MIFSNSFGPRPCCKPLYLLVVGIASAALFGCAVTPPSPALPPGRAPASGDLFPEQASPVPGEESSPGQSEAADKSSEGIREARDRGKATANHYSRVAASNSFTGIGKRLLEKGDPDGAIRMLERSVGINPSDGPGYYYLAEAWLIKGNPLLAGQFNHLALVHLRHDRRWMAHAEDQLHRIQAQTE